MPYCGMQGGGGGGRGEGGLVFGIQGSSTLLPSFLAGGTPGLSLTPNCTFGSGNVDPSLSQSANNPFSFRESLSATFNFTSSPTNTEPVANVISAAATKNYCTVKRAVRRRRR